MKIPLIAVPLTLMAAIMLPVFPAFAQGPLTPPGAPAPSMKTLAQIEPRTPISSLPYTISSPGAYYVATNTLTGTSGNSGITISANNVTLDLMGFTLTGVDGSVSGIVVPSSQVNVVIRNGILVNWGGYGINAINANYCQIFNVIVVSSFGGLITGSGSMVVNCQASSNVIDGITVSNNATIKDCIAVTNGSAGFVAGANVVITGCAASFNGTNGFVTGDNAALSSCTAGQNGNSMNSPGAGYLIGNYCTIIGCSANRTGYNAVLRGGYTVNGINTGAYCLIKDCAANNCFSGSGISTGASCKVKDCSACNNDYGASVPSGNGITVGDLSSVSGCIATENVFDGIACGNWCTIFDNTCVANSPDIYATGSGNTINHNIVSMTISAGANNLVGTTVTSSSSMNSGVNPHANFASPGTFPPN